MNERAPLTRDTVLVRAPELVVRLGDDGRVRIETDGEDLMIPRHALALLEAFAYPRAVGEAIAWAGLDTPDRVDDAASTVQELRDAGVLCIPGERKRETALGFVKPAIHIAMLDDRERTSAFCDALRKSVRSDDVVVDIGTGTGILAASAALAGARRVFAIEATAIADIAEQVFAANRVDDRVELLRHYSTDANLPERGTLLVTETIGNDPLDEEIIDIVIDARRRLLQPSARVIPSHLEVFALPVDVPSAFLERHVFTPRHVDQYRRDYGVDLTPVLAHRLGTKQSIPVRTHDAMSWPVVAAPVSLVRLDFEGELEPSFRRSATFELLRETRALGVLMAFRATLAEGIVLSTLPGEVRPENNWRYALWPVLDHLRAPLGAAFSMTLEYERGVTAVSFARQA